jgi:RNA polymerase sigma factor (sigma-70 family)
MAGEDWVATLDAVVSGDRAALARLSRLVTARLRALGAYDLRDEWDDICQEVILALVRARKAGGVESAGRVVGFVRTTAFRHYCDWIRAHLRQPRAVGGGLDSRVAVLAAQEGRTGLARQAELLELVSRLESEVRYALVAHVVEGRTFEEIASDLEVSRPTAVRRVAEGRAELRRLYQEGEAPMDASPRPILPARVELRANGSPGKP